MAGNNRTRYGRYRRILAVVLLLLSLTAALALAGCGGEKTAVETQEEETETVEEDEGTEDENSDWREEEEENEEYAGLGREYTNNLFGFSVAYPDDWELEETEDGKGCTMRSTLDGDVLLVSVSVFGEYNLDEQKPEELVDDYAEIVESVAGGPIERDPSTLTLGTFDGAEYAIDYWSSESDLGAYLYDDVMFVVKGDKLYSFVATYPVEFVDEVDPIISAMIDSFALLE